MFDVSVSKVIRDNLTWHSSMFISVPHMISHKAGEASLTGVITPVEHPFSLPPLEVRVLN